MWGAEYDVPREEVHFDKSAWGACISRKDLAMQNEISGARFSWLIES